MFAFSVLQKDTQLPLDISMKNARHFCFFLNFSTLPFDHPFTLSML